MIRLTLLDDTKECWNRLYVFVYLIVLLIVLIRIVQYHVLGNCA
jgi:hypothetical protein